MSKVTIMGVPFDSIKMEDALQKVIELIKRPGPALVVTPNPEMLVNSSNVKELHQALNSADLVIADGIGVIYAAKILRKPLKNRVTGIDLMTEVLGHLAKTKGSYFLFGSKPGVADKAALIINDRFKGIECVGTQHGYFSVDEEDDIIDRINKANPDVLFVGLGSPKQEVWVHSNLKRLETPVCMCIGGAIDVYSGNIDRAPKWVMKIGMEWLYRAIKEPKRFKRLLKIPVFFVKIFTVKG